MRIISPIVTVLKLPPIPRPIFPLEAQCVRKVEMRVLLWRCGVVRLVSSSTPGHSGLPGPSEGFDTGFFPVSSDNFFEQPQ